MNNLLVCWGSQWTGQHLYNHACRSDWPWTLKHHARPKEWLILHSHLPSSISGQPASPALCLFFLSTTLKPWCKSGLQLNVVVKESQSMCQLLARQHQLVRRNSSLILDLSRCISTLCEASAFSVKDFRKTCCLSGNPTTDSTSPCFKNFEKWMFSFLINCPPLSLECLAPDLSFLPVQTLRSSGDCLSNWVSATSVGHRDCSTESQRWFKPGWPCIGMNQQMGALFQSLLLPLRWFPKKLFLKDIFIWKLDFREEKR